MPDNTQMIVDRLEGIDGKVTGLVGEVGGIKATLEGHGREIGRLADICEVVKDNVSGLSGRVGILESTKTPRTSIPPAVVAEALAGRRNGFWGKIASPALLLPVIVSIAILLLYAIGSASGAPAEVTKQRVDAIQNVMRVLTQVQKDVAEVKKEQRLGEALEKREEADKAATVASPL